MHLPAEQIGQRGHAAAIRHMNHVDPGHHLEQLARDMCAASDTDRRHADLAGIGIRVEDKLGNRLSWDRWIYRHDIWCADNASDWRDIATEIEAELVVKRRIGC